MTFGRIRISLICLSLVAMPLGVIAGPLGEKPAPEERELQSLIACLSASPESRFGAQKQLFAQRLAKLGIYLAEDPKKPFFDDLSLALLLRHFKATRPEGPIVLAAPEATGRTEEDPLLVSSAAPSALKLPSTMPRRPTGAKPATVLSFGKSAFDSSLAHFTKELKKVYEKNPEFFANGSNQLTFEYENSLTQRLDALTLDSKQLSAAILKRYGVKTEPFENFENEELENLPAQEWPQSELVLILKQFEDLPPSVTRRMKLQRLVRVRNGVPFRDESKRAEYSRKHGSIRLSGTAFDEGARRGEQSLAHELGHAVYAGLSPEEKSLFESISWRKDGALSRAVDPRQFVSAYAASSPEEDFAETFARYLRDSARVKAKSPAKYRYLKDRLFADREYFTVVPKNARIQIESDCEDEAPPYFSRPLQEAVQISCEISPTNPERMRVVMKLSGLADDGVGVNTQVYDLVAQLQSDKTGEGMDLPGFSPQDGFRFSATGTPGEFRYEGSWVDRSRYYPDESFRLANLTIRDLANNEISWHDSRPLWDSFAQEFVPTSPFSFLAPGTRVKEKKTVQSQELAPQSVSVSEGELLLNWGHAFAEVEDRIGFVYFDGPEGILLRQQIELPTRGTQIRIPLPSSALNGEYSFSRIKIGNVEFIAPTSKVRMKVTVDSGKVENQKSAVVQVDQMVLSEMKSQSNLEGGATSIRVKLPAQFFGERDSTQVGFNVVDPKGKAIHCSKLFKENELPQEGAPLEISCDLPQGHLAGEYSFEEITVEEIFGNSKQAKFVRKSDITLARRGIKKTLQVRDLAPEPQPILAPEIR